MELSHHLSETGKTLSKRMRSYYQEDPWFLDVQEAEEQGLLPSSQPSGKPNVPVDDEGMIENQSDEENGMMVCERSLTYVMETSDAGFGKSLMGLWMSYGLAQKEDRAFFVDDTRWYAQFYPYPNYHNPRLLAVQLTVTGRTAIIRLISLRRLLRVASHPQSHKFFLVLILPAI